MKTLVDKRLCALILHRALTASNSPEEMDGWRTQEPSSDSSRSVRSDAGHYAAAEARRRSPEGADLRCIITNIPTENDGKSRRLWRATVAAINEDLYCRRGSACELKFHELKDESRAQRVS